MVYQAGFSLFCYLYFESCLQPLSKKQKSNGKKSKDKKARSKSGKDRLFDDDLYNPWHSNDHESDEDYAPSRDEIEASTKENNRDKEVVPSMKGEPKERNNSAMLFNTALIKAGSKSFKDPQVTTLPSYVVCHSFEIVYTSQACGFALYPEI